MPNIFKTDTDDDRLGMLEIMIKIGEVSSVDYAKGTARVVFDDDDALVSYDLQVLQRNTLNNNDYAMPDVGEDVVCLFLASGSEAGFILGSVYAGDVLPPESGEKLRYTQFADGSKFSCDWQSSVFNVSIGDTAISAGRSDITIKTSNNVNIKGDGNSTLEGGQKVTVKVGSTSAILQSSKATVTASNVTLKGNITLDGNVSVTGSVTANGDVSALAGVVNLSTHTHPGVTPGSGSTGPGIG